MKVVFNTQQRCKSRGSGDGASLSVLLCVCYTDEELDAMQATSSRLTASDAAAEETVEFFFSFHWTLPFVSSVFMQ